MTQRVFDETLRSPPPGFEFGAGLSNTRLGALSDIPRARIVPGLAQQVASFTDVDVFLNISKGQIATDGCIQGLPCCCAPCDTTTGPFNFLNFTDTPSCGGCAPSFHGHADAFNCGPLAEMGGYADIRIDLSAFPFAGNQVTLLSLFTYSYSAIEPIPQKPIGVMNLIVWGPSGVGSDWLHGSGSLFAGSVLPGFDDTLTPFTFSPNVDLSGFALFYLETALLTEISSPGIADQYIGPQTLRLRATELLDIIVLAQGDGPIEGATAQVLSSKGVVVATATTDPFGVASFALAPDNYFAESLLGSLSQASSLLSPVSQSVTFIWGVPKPKVTYSQVALSAGQPNTFLDASASTDPVNDTFTWDFGDGTSQTGVGLVKVQHFYGAGIFTLKLTETSLDSLSGTITLTIQGPRL